MASFIYQHAMEEIFKGNIDLDGLTFRKMLVASGYTPDKDVHDFRDDVTNEITGTGYTAGGEVCDVSVARDDGNGEIDVVFPQTQWAGITIDGAGAAGEVIYVARGGAASADEIVAFIDYGGDVDAAGGNFTSLQSTLTIQNPSV